MSSFHLSPFLDSNNNFYTFSPFSSNIIDKSLLYIFWNDIIFKPSFCNISFTGSYNDLSNKPYLSDVAINGNYNNLIDKPWIISNNNIYNTNINNIGIGISNPLYKLDIDGDINFTGSLNNNGSLFKTSQWNNSNFDIFYNNGNIGLGKSTNINEKLDIFGNIKIAGNIFPNDNNLYNLGSSNLKWKDLYLSGNSIYLDNIIIYTSNNNINIKDNNNNFKGININEININSNNNNYKIALDNNNNLIFNSNNTIYYPIIFKNNYDYSNIVFSNILISTSNNLNNKINSLNTNTIILGSNNRFIINDIYDRDINFTKSIITSNIITSNLNVIGDDTIINSSIYQTEQLEINNNKNNVSLIINQSNTNFNIIEFYKNNQIVLIINSNGNLGINNSNPLYNVDINGNINCIEIFIKEQNISNIIDDKITINSNILINYNNLINKSILSSIALSNDYNYLINKPWININNNIYNSNIGNIGIGKTNPEYKLDINDNLNSTEIFIKEQNISNLIDDKIIINSNFLIDYNNLINKPIISLVGISGDYNDLINKPLNFEGTNNYNDLINKQWININNNIYNSNIGNIGIGKTNPEYKLDINDNINSIDIFIKNQNISNLIDDKIIINSNFLINYNNLINKPIISSVGISGDYNDLINKPLLSLVALTGNYNDLINKSWININNDIYNSNIGNIGIGKTNPEYKLDINDNLNSIDIFIKNQNISNIINNNISLSSNILYNKINYLNTDTILLGSNNRFIINDVYNRDINFTKNIIASNIITSNLSVIGDNTILNTTLYETEQLQIINDTNACPLIINQLNNNFNIVEFYNNNVLSLIINSNGNLGINNSNPLYNIDINGNLNSTEIFIKEQNISNIIDNKIILNSNFLINYNNLINKPILSSITSTGDYNDLINKPWININNNIYNSNIGNIGIGKTNPEYKLDINDNLNSIDIFIKNQNISNLIDNKIIINSNFLIDYNNLINKPIISLVGISGDYNDLLDKPTIQNNTSNYNQLYNTPWININNNIYNSNIGNIGIGKTNPEYKLDITGDININGLLRLSNINLPFTTYSNTNIISSNGNFNYINNSNYGYYIFLTNGTITFPQLTYADILLVGAGGNGGLTINSGGGGAGEVIYYPNYLFNIGTSNIIIGTQSINSNNRITKITSNNNDIIIAKGGGDGGYGSTTIITSATITNGTNNTINGTNYNYIVYTTTGVTGTITFSVNTQCDIFMIGGGGAGGFNHGGGGGAGAYLTSNYTFLSGVTYNITIGTGGIAQQSLNTPGTNGQPTIITKASDSSIIFQVNGGGNGGGGNNVVGSSGGCGGGGIGWNENVGSPSYLGGSSITSNGIGFAGGNGGRSYNTNYFMGGGGGGCGSVGTLPNATIAGSGGNAIKTNIKGFYEYYGGGGGTYYYNGGSDNTKNGLGGQLDGVIVGGYLNSSGTKIAPVSNSGSGGSGGYGGYGIGGNGANGIVIIKYLYSTSNIVLPTSGGSGGGGYINQNGASFGIKWNINYSYSSNGFNGSSNIGGNGGSASNNGFIEQITGSNLIIGLGGSGATSNSIPTIKNIYGSGGDGNGGLGTQGIVIIKVPLNLNNSKFDGFTNYSNIINIPYINDLFTSKNYIDFISSNQVNFSLANISLANEWFLYKGNSPTNISNSFIFWHLNSNINSKWWFNGTINATNNEISDIRIKKDIINILNPLDKLNLLQPKEYMLCDEKDYLKKYGIIAQDVKEVLPEFVYTDEDYIANIYSKCIYIKELINNNYVYKLITEINISELININDELKILLDNLNNNKEIIIEDLPYHNRYKKRYVKVKSIINNYTIEITEELELLEIEKNNIFIYGKKVKDFLKLDYSSLYTLNISSTQELYKLLKEQELIIDYLEDKLNNLEK